jgi:hypothetical protein
VVLQGDLSEKEKKQNLKKLIEEAKNLHNDFSKFTTDTFVYRPFFKSYNNIEILRFIQTLDDSFPLEKIPPFEKK